MSNRPTIDQSSNSPIRSRSVKLLILCIGLAILVLAMGMSFKIAISGIVGKPTLRTKLYDEKTIHYGDRQSRDKIAVIPLSGPIKGNGSFIVGSDMVYELSGQLRQAKDDSLVRGIVIQLDSPGGGLTASDLIYHELQLLKQTGKPVLVMVNGLAASGGLYISAAADHIIATPTSMIGSIGVIMNRFMIKELMNKIGVKPDVVKSGNMKDIGSPFREMTPDERKFFEQLIGAFHERFMSIVAEGRDIPLEEVRKLANGLIYTADQALEYKLIDEIGYFDEALNKIVEMAGLESARFIRYERPLDFQSVMKRFEARSRLDVNSLRQMLSSSDLIEEQPQFLLR